MLQKTPLYLLLLIIIKDNDFDVDAAAAELSNRSSLMSTGSVCFSVMATGSVCSSRGSLSQEDEIEELNLASETVEASEELVDQLPSEPPLHQTGEENLDVEMNNSEESNQEDK